MALAPIYSCLVSDSPAQVATAMLVEVCGSTAEATASCGSLELAQDRGWGGWGSNPRPADYEKYGPLLHAH